MHPPIGVGVRERTSSYEFFFTPEDSQVVIFPYDIGMGWCIIGGMKKLILALATGILFSVSTPVLTYAASLQWTDTNTVVQEEGTRIFARVGAGPKTEIGIVGPDVTTFPVTLSTTEVSCFTVQAFVTPFNSPESNEVCTIQLNAPGGLIIVP